QAHDEEGAPVERRWPARFQPDRDETGEEGADQVRGERAPRKAVAHAAQQHAAQPEAPRRTERAAARHQEQLLPPSAHASFLPVINTSDAATANAALKPNAHIGEPFSHKVPKTADAGNNSNPVTR